MTHPKWLQPLPVATRRLQLSYQEFARAILCRRNTSSKRLDGRPPSGYTFGMKTAVSIPDDVFEDAERLASRLRTSRSQLYARALAEFVARHDDDRVTALMDQAVREAGGEADAFLQVAAQQSLQRVEW